MSRMNPRCKTTPWGPRLRKVCISDVDKGMTGRQSRWSQQARLSSDAVKDSEDDNNWRSLLITCDMSGRDAESTDNMDRISSINAAEYLKRNNISTSAARGLNSKGGENWRQKHHHYEHAPSWSVAVSTSCFHRPPSWAWRHVEFSPWLSGWRSASRVRIQVWRGRPGRRFESLASPRIDLCRALNRSSESPILATCPRTRSHLVWMSGSSCGGEPAHSRTSALVTWICVWYLQDMSEKNVIKDKNMKPKKLK